MGDPGDNGSGPAIDTEPLAGDLEELSEPLDPLDSGTDALRPGTMLAPENEEPITILRLLKDGSPLKLYEARQEDNEEMLWLRERSGESAAVLTAEGALLQEVRCPMFPRVQASFELDRRSYLATEALRWGNARRPSRRRESRSSQSGLRSLPGGFCPHQAPRIGLRPPGPPPRRDRPGTSDEDHRLF